MTFNVHHNHCKSAWLQVFKHMQEGQDQSQIVCKYYDDIFAVCYTLNGEYTVLLYYTVLYKLLYTYTNGIRLNWYKVRNSEHTHTLLPKETRWKSFKTAGDSRLDAEEPSWWWLTADTAYHRNLRANRKRTRERGKTKTKAQTQRT